MIVHILTVRKKMALMRALRLKSRIDRMVVYSSRQRDLIVAALSYPSDRIVLSPFMVDTTFFAPTPSTRPARRMICSAGLEFRDYPTMVEAVRDLDVEVILAAASPWSKRRDVSGDVAIPANVTVDRFGFADLRTLYASAEFVVVPLVDTDFQAGITTILEAMAMGKAVICTRTRGQVDVIVDGSTGIYVPPGDTSALRTAIERLLDDHDLAARLGSAARTWAVAEADIETYADSPDRRGRRRRRNRPPLNRSHDVLRRTQLGTATGSSSSASSASSSSSAATPPRRSSISSGCSRLMKSRTPRHREGEEDRRPSVPRDVDVGEHDVHDHVAERQRSRTPGGWDR